MKSTLENIKIDSFSGLILGLESLKGGMTLLNGPTGCKFYHSAVIDGATLRSTSFDPQSYPERFYFGQSRVPCTYLDAKDYVYGVKDKLKELLIDIRDRNPDFIAIINSPGAALIGDDLEKIAGEVDDLPLMLYFPTPIYSEEFGKGVSQGMIELVRNLKISNEPISHTRVNLLGFSILQNHVLGNINYLKYLFNMAGIEVGTCFFNEDISTISDFNKSCLNIVLAPEECLDFAKYLEQEFNMPYFIPSMGQPVGFLATESFFRELSEILPMHLEFITEEIEKARGRAYIYLARYSSLLGMPKGATYDLNGPSSFLYPLNQFLKNYLGMVPREINCRGGSYPEFKNMLNNETLATDSDVRMVFGDGNDIVKAKAYDKKICGLEIEGPTRGYYDVVEKTLYGPQGSLYIIEKILNGLQYGEDLI